MGLFRQEAQRAQRERLQGQVVLLPRWPHAAVATFLLLWVVAATVFLDRASYSRRETVRGWLEPAAGVIRVYPQSEGRLASMLVKSGDTVSAGQTLAIINGDRILRGGENLETLLLIEYQSQAEILRRQLRRANSLATARREELRLRLASGESELEQLDAQLDAVDRRLALATIRQHRHKQLAAAGYLNQATLDDLYERTLVLESEKRNLGLQRLRQESRLQDLAASLARLPQEAGNEADRLRLELSSVAQKIARLRGNRAHLVQAPRAGRVGMLGITEGQEARYGKPILTLLPTESPLVARLLVPVRAGGFLAQGQQLAIRYDAYPFQKYGVHGGRLVSIADSATLPTEQVYLPLAINEPVFRTTARLASSRIYAHGEQLPLKAGMTLSADIILERRSILQWLLEPLYSLRGRLT